MPRRELPIDDVHQDRWIISYADFITLLFAFFVVMYSLSSVNEEKYKELSDSLSGAFQGIGFDPSIIGAGHGAIISIGDEPATSVKQDSEPETITEPDQENTDRLDIIHQKLEERILPTISDRDLKVEVNELWLSLELRSNMLFRSGQAIPTAVADEILERLAVILRPYENPIHVEGFTDNDAVSGDLFPSNWELSAARAAAVVRLLSHYGVDPQRLAAVGYGEYQPAYSNRTEEGRQLNRRVVIVISRDEKVRRTLTAYGSQQVSEDAVTTVISTDDEASETLIEQVDTEAGGKLFRQISPEELLDQQEVE